MMKRVHLRQFLAVVEAGSFTRAAEQIGIAQPSLSAGIAELERLLGARLFLREHRRVRLTSAGNRLLAHARLIEREFRQAETDLSGARASVAPLRLGVIHSLSSALLARIVSRYAGDRALTLVEGGETELRRRLTMGQIDAALTLLHLDDEGSHSSIILVDEPYRLMLGERHALARRSQVEVADIADETMIARRSCEILAETSRFFTQRGVRPPFFLRSANDDRCMEMVRIGMGITTAPQSLARAGIVAVPLAGYHFRRRIGLISGARAEQDSSMAALHVTARLATAEALDGPPRPDS